MPQLDDPAVTVADELKSTGRMAGLQDGESVVFTGQNIIDLITDTVGAAEVTGNTVTAPNDSTVAWKAVAASNSPGENLIEGRLPDDTLVGAIGTSYDTTCEGFASVVNALPVPVWDGGEQDPDALVEVPGMQPGDLMFYVVAEGS
jgi:hypothetical protein